MLYLLLKNGNEATCDQIQMKKGGVAFGILSASDDVKRIHHDMIKNNNYKNPISWLDIAIENYQGVILTGGHSKGIISYLESDLLKEKIYKFWKLKRPIGAISRGVLLLSKIQNPKTDESILRKKKYNHLSKTLRRCCLSSDKDSIREIIQNIRKTV